MVAPSLNIDERFFQLVVLVLPLVVEDTLLLLAITLLRLPTSAVLPVAMASNIDPVVPAKNRVEV